MIYAVLYNTIDADLVVHNRIGGTRSSNRPADAARRISPKRLGGAMSRLGHNDRKLSARFQRGGRGSPAESPPLFPSPSPVGSGGNIS